MTIPLKTWTRGSAIRAADLNRMVEAIRRATPVAGNGISVSQSLGGSVISFTGKAGGSGGVAEDGGDFPFKIQRVNSGTLENPVWHTLVYIPQNAISVASLIAASNYEIVCDTDDTQEYDHANMPNWYEYDKNDGFGVIGLQLKIAATSSSPTATYRCYFRLARYGVGISGWLPQYSNNKGTQEIALGVVSGSGAGEVYNLIRSGVWTSRVNFFGGSGNVGTAVEITDERGGSTAPGIVGYGGSQGGVVSLIVKNGVAIDLVFMDADAAVSLDEYLSGGTEVTGMGTNVNTDNFADECLGDVVVDEDAADPDKAAPSFHKHKLSQLVNEEGDLLDGDDVVSFFSNVGLWDALGETGPSGEGPSENSILTVGDIEDDASYLKPDSETPSAGDVTTDLLVLSGHRHPLNVADVIMATGPTGSTPTPPPVDDYVLPVGVGVTGPSGTDSPTTAEFGVMPYYARADHVHPICDEMGPTGGSGTDPTGGPQGGINESMDAANGDSLPTGPSGVVLDQTTWTPGAQGLVESYCCRIAKAVDSGFPIKYAIFRRRKVSRTGAVLWVGPEYVGFSF